MPTIIGQLSPSGQKEDTAEYTPLPDLNEIRPGMSVFGSCGGRLGKVDRLVGGYIKLARSGSRDGLHHFVPVSWISVIEEDVHLLKDLAEAHEEWDI